METKEFELADSLLAWYDENKRDLPWRREPTPYHVWISEIMLQQTRVETVKEYYKRFLEAFPDIRALALAPEDRYLKLWEGLGYYSRVRNLHKAAEQVMEEHGGELPGTAKELVKLPGIGAYTSSAIASICFGEKTPAIDGNLLRVFARLSLYEENIKTPAAQKAAYAFFQERMPEDRPGDFNQALMDLGSVICAPGQNPTCESCPLRDGCQGHKKGREKELPVMPAKKSRKVEKKTVFVIHSGELTAVRKRPAKGLLAGLYEFPSARGWLDQDEALEWLKENEIAALRIKDLPEARHIFSHKEWHMKGFEVFIDSTEEDSVPFRMVTTSQILDEHAIPSAFASFVERLRASMV